MDQSESSQRARRLLIAQAGQTYRDVTPADPALAEPPPTRWTYGQEPAPAVRPLDEDTTEEIDGDLAKADGDEPPPANDEVVLEEPVAA